MARFPKKQIEKLDEQFDQMQEQKSSLNVNDIQKAPVREEEPTFKMSQQEIKKSSALRIMPTKTFGAKDSPKPEHEALRKRAWEYVESIVEHRELSGEPVKFWFKPAISGESCHYWEIPTNTLVSIPRMLAEHLSTRRYSRHTMRDKAFNTLQHGDIMQTMVIEEQIQRIDCRPASNFGSF